MTSTTENVTECFGTLEEFLALPVDTRAEFIDGRIVMSPPAGWQHADLVTELLTALRNRFDRHAFRVCTERGLAIPNGNHVIPDVMLFEAGQESHTVWLEAVPLLCIEVVSPGNASNDYVRKLQTYAALGVAHYWILDPRDGEIEVRIYGLKEGRYVEQTFTGSFRLPEWNVEFALDLT